MSSEIDVIYHNNSGLIERVKTGLWSFDVAAGNRSQYGLPLRTLIEIYGYPSVGKSSLSYFLAGKIAFGGGIELLDLEGFDQEYVLSSLRQAKYKGKLRVVPHIDSKGKINSHSKMADDFLEYLNTNQEFTVGIFDSAGAFVSNMEIAGDVGDANMGKRAQAVNQIMRKSIAYIHSREEKPLTFLVVNHVHSVIGGRGHETPAGMALKYLASSRIYLWQKKVIESGDKILGFLVGGKFEKLRFGGKGRSFQFVLIPGIGVNPDLTAVYDCVSLGLATDDRTIKIGDKNFGYASKTVDLALNGKSEKFAPFYSALEEYYERLAMEGNSMESNEENTNTNGDLQVLD